MRASAGAARALALAALAGCALPARGGELVLAGEGAPAASEIAQRYAIVGAAQWSAPAGSSVQWFDPADAALIADPATLRDKYAGSTVLYDYWGEPYAALFNAWESGDHALSIEQTLCSFADAHLFLNSDVDFLLRMFSTAHQAVQGCQVVGGVGDVGALQRRFTASGNRTLVVQSLTSDANPMQELQRSAVARALLSVLPGLVFMLLCAYALGVLRAGARTLPSLIRLVLWSNVVLSAFLGLILLLAGGYVGVFLDSSRLRIKYATAQMLLASSAGIDILLIVIVRSILSIDGRTKLQKGNGLAKAGFAVCVAIDATQVTFSALNRFWTVYSVYLPLAATAAEIACCALLFFECRRLRRHLQSSSSTHPRMMSLHRRLVFAGNLAVFATVASSVATFCYSFLGGLVTPTLWSAAALAIMTSRAALVFGHILSVMLTAPTASHPRTTCRGTRVRACRLSLPHRRTGAGTARSAQALLGTPRSPLSPQPARQRRRGCPGRAAPHLDPASSRIHHHPTPRRTQGESVVLLTSSPTPECYSTPASAHAQSPTPNPIFPLSKLNKHPHSFQTA
jgi:hypothetical protein